MKSNPQRLLSGQWPLLAVDKLSISSSARLLVPAARLMLACSVRKSTSTEHRLPKRLPDPQCLFSAVRKRLDS